MAAIHLPGADRRPPGTALRTVLTAVLFIVCAVVPVPASAVADPAPSRPLTGRGDAFAVARDTGRPVEIAAARSADTEVYANPHGTLTAVVHARPQRVRRGSGWVDVDPTLVRRADGRVTPVATAVPMVFGGGGSTELVTLAADAATPTGGGAGPRTGDVASLTLTWPTPLPRPRLAGPTATYPEVLPGVDLVVRADVTGFTETLVVRDRAAARNPALDRVRFGLRSTGLRVAADADGNISARTATGEVVFGGGTPLMWDTAPAGPGPGGSTRAGGPVPDVTGPAPGARSRPMAVVLDGSTVEVRPDRAMLDDPVTRYPVHLDPPFTGGRFNWTSVWRTFPNTRYWNSADVARVGYESQEGNLNRSLFAMNTSAVVGKRIVRATFRAFETYAWSCSGRPVQLWHTGGIDQNTTWNNQPAWHHHLGTVWAAKGYSSACNQGGVDFDATWGVQLAADSGWQVFTLGLRAENESDTFGWKKFRNDPVLEIEYNSRPDQPSNLHAEAGVPCRTGAQRPYVAATTPTLKAVLTDPDGWAGQHLYARFEWWVPGGAQRGAYATATAPSGSTFQVTVPAGAFADGEVIAWRVRADDGHTAGDYGPWCELAVDQRAPDRSPLVTSHALPEDDWGAAGVGRPAEVTFTADGVDDVAGYVYGVNQDPPTSWAPASQPGGAATVSVTPMLDGPQTLVVRSRDLAGNLGPVRRYLFYAWAGAGPVAHWRFETVAAGRIDDAAGAHPLTVRGGAAVRADATAPAGAGSLATGADGDHAGTAGPVVRTDTSFSVGAWLRLREGTGWRTAIVQNGAHSSRFALQYSPEAGGRWVFNLADEDARPTSTLAVSSEPAHLDRWTYAVGVYDAGAAQVRLYIDGILVDAVPHTFRWHADGPVWIGTGWWYDTAGGQWAGDVDDVRIWDRVVTGDEIHQLAASYDRYLGPNLARRQPATADSACAPDEGPGRAVDGSTAGNSKWCSTSGDRWLSVDLGGRRTLDEVTVRHAAAGGEPAVWNTRDFDLQVSDDAVAWTTVAEVRGNTAAVSHHPLAPEAAGRYLRLLPRTPTQDGDPAARIYEIEVAGS